MSMELASLTTNNLGGARFFVFEHEVEELSRLRGGPDMLVSRLRGSPPSHVERMLDSIF